MELTEEARALLSDKVFAHVAVTDERGRPHVSPVWVDVRDGKVFFNTEQGRVKARLIKQGTPVALSALDAANPYRWLLIRGTVVERTTEGGAAGIDALAKKYFGTDRYGAHDPARKRINVLVEPDEIVLHG